MLDAIKFLVTELRNSGRKSRYVNLTITHLETAELFWLREIGVI